MELTPALREFTNAKFERLKKFKEHIISVHITFNVDKVNQIAEAKIKLHGTEIHAKSESENMYHTIDDLIDKVIRQLTKYKEKHETY
jgi:putative sigma-54 modulation protein